MKTHLYFLFFFIATYSSAINYYITPTGSNSNNGTSLATAFATIQKAHDVSMPGDVINVADGTYNATVIITRSGTSTNWITYKSMNKGGAKVTNNWGICFDIGDINNTSIQNVSYIIIDGFDLKATATYGFGVASDWFAHHITVRNCYVHDCGASGLQLNHGDYLLVENNICKHNSTLFNNLSGSGISLYGKKRFDSKPGFHNIIRGNICYNNVNGPASPKSDGNGIIIDDQRCVQTYHSPFGTPKDLNYTDFATLIENNLCYGNEGAGIQIFLSNNVTVRNNTAYNNQIRRTSDTWRGDFSASCSANIIFANNISLANSSLRADGGSTDWSGFSYNNAFGAFALTGDEYGANYTYFNNMTYDINNTSSNSVFSNGITVSVIGVNGNKCAVNPMFINPGVLSTSDFHLQASSPAINFGTATYGLPTVDLEGNVRVQGGTVDMGCYEFGVTTSVSDKNVYEYIQVFPNPANEVVSINYYLKEKSEVKIVVFDELGRETANIIDKTQLAGQHKQDLNTELFNNGIYFIQINSNGVRSVSKLIINK